MLYTLTILETLFDSLADTVFSKRGLEGAAYVLCGVSRTANETRLLARTLVPVKDEHYLVREPTRLSIASESYASVAKQAKLAGEAVLFVHSHPTGFDTFSEQDDREEPKLLSFIRGRAPGLPHAALVLWSKRDLTGRVWQHGTTWEPLTRTRVIGRRFRVVEHVKSDIPIPEFFDRQVRAFGPEIQALLSRLYVGVIGAGGTGSATIEQLARLGVGTISVFDGDTLADTNVTRIHGSGLAQEGEKKVEVQHAHVKAIGLGTKLIPYPKHINDEETAKALRECEFLFGCTDNQGPRSTLVRLSHRYLIPVFDTAVKIDSKDGVIRGITGRVTTLLPEEACLFCRGRIDSGTIRAENLPPEQRERELIEGYAPELGGEEPAVVTFTTAVAAQAVSELLHRLTGFMGEERVSSETLLLFGENRLRSNRDKPNEACMCQDRTAWGKGDTKNFLGKTW